MFIATGNMIETIPPALRDRMEIINIPGYTEYEKLQIAQFFLLPKQLNNHGFKKNDIEISEKAMKKIIKESVHQSDVIIARLPSLIGRVAIKEAIKKGKPYFVEVVGN